MNQLGQPPSGSCYVSVGNRQAPSYPDRGTLGFFPMVFTATRDRPSQGECEGQDSGVSRQVSARKIISYVFFGETEKPPSEA
jgi:hypothetical protein